MLLKWVVVLIGLGGRGLNIGRFELVLVSETKFHLSVASHITTELLGALDTLR